MRFRNPPPTSYAVTAVVVVLLFIAFLLAVVVQVVLAVLTLPLLLCKGGRQRFHHIQSFVFRGVNGFICAGLNPLWCTEVHWLGKNARCSTRPGRGSVFFCNHRSNSDPWFSAWALSRSCIEGRYVYKSSLKKLPVIGWCMQLAGDLDVKFGDKEQIVRMLEKAKDTLKQGYNLVVFPEGTRSPSGILQDFKPSFFKICAELDCPAVPVCMLGTERAWPLNTFRMGRARVQVALGEPLRAEAPDGSEKLSKAVEESMRAMARELLGELDPEDARGSQQGVDLEYADPFITGRPYAWWRAPPELQALSVEEQVRLLRTGRTHERGARLL